MTWAERARKCAKELRALIEEHDPEMVYSEHTACELEDYADLWDKEHPERECSECKGAGGIETNHPRSIRWVTCSTCEGTGRVRS